MLAILIHTRAWLGFAPLEFFQASLDHAWYCLQFVSKQVLFLLLGLRHRYSIAVLQNVPNLDLPREKVLNVYFVPMNGKALQVKTDSYDVSLVVHNHEIQCRYPQLSF